MESVSFLQIKHIQDARRALKTDGVLLIRNGYTAPVCESIIRLIDDYNPKAGDNVVNQFAGSELRIYDAQDKADLLNAFYQQCNVFISCLWGVDTVARTLLAIRNKALRPDDEKSKTGRWHLDSFRKQYEIFLFLTDTTETSDPFEYIPGTHTARFRYEMMFRGKFIRAGDLFRHGARAYQSPDEGWVRELADHGYKSVPVLCKAGRVMVVDVTAVHRARPCLEGCRYALTAYR